MNRTMSRLGCAGVLLVAALVCVPLPKVSAQGTGQEDPEPLEMAARIVRSSRAPGGICSVLGRTDADLAMSLAKQGSFQVHCLYRQRELCDAMRKTIRSGGQYGTVSADVLETQGLPYTDNLINIVVIDSYPTLRDSGVPPEEVLRVLAPLGTAYLGTSSASTQSRIWVKELTATLRTLGIDDATIDERGGTWVCVKKPWPADIDDWPHYLHGADGNPVAQDRVVGPPKRYQWVCGPKYQRSHETDSSISTVVTSRGRLFFFVDEAPISLAGDHSLPDKWFLVARDAFNGVLLWKVPIRRWGWREWKPTWFTNRPGDFPLNRQKRLVATEDHVYVTLGYRAPVSQLDARTGEVLKTYAGTEQTGEILHVHGRLILSVLADGQIKVMAVDAATGEQVWVTERAYRGSTVDYLKWSSRYASVERPELDPSLNTATDGNVVALIDGPDLVALDFQTGAEKWRASFPSDDADRTAGGIQSDGNLWIGTMIVSDGAVIHASPNKLAAFAADTGELLWSQPKKYIGHLWYEWKDVFVIEGLVWTWSAELNESTFEIGGGRKQRELWPQSVNGYDVKTGAMKKSVPLGPIFNTYHHHRCYRNKATLRYILASRRGTEFVDLEDGNHTVHNWVRGTCHVGMMPANGLQYAPPHPCQCYINEKLSGFGALAPAGGSRVQGLGSRVETRLEHGPAYGMALNPGPWTLDPDRDWPAFRHDSMRTGSVSTTVPEDAGSAWSSILGRRVSPPIVAAGRLYAALVDEHHVVCLDAQDGSTLWESATGGRIDSPPTYHNGTVIFGSADGSVYCLRATDGELVWRFHAAPDPMLIGAFGQLESAWPVHGSVLVQNGTAYFAAGRSSQLDGGISLYGLDAATGKLLHQAKLAGPDYVVGDFDENFKLPMGSLPDILMGDGSNIYMRSLTFDAELKPKREASELQIKAGFLDDAYFKRTQWTFKKEYSRLLVHDKRSVYYVRMFDSLRGLDPTVFFTPSSKGYLLFAKNIQDGQSTWRGRVPVRIRAMVLTEDWLFVAGPPDVVDPKDPLGAFEGRKGGLLYAFDAASGEKLTERKLPFPPVFNGVAAANGRLYLVDENGSITCFAKP